MVKCYGGLVNTIGKLLILMHGVGLLSISSLRGPALSGIIIHTAAVQWRVIHVHVHVNALLYDANKNELHNIINFMCNNIATRILEVKLM